MSVVEFYPTGVFGLHWEATEVDGDGEVRGIVLAESGRDGVAIAHVEQPNAVVFATRAEFARLREMLLGGDFDHLLPSGRRRA
ncbi:hypothetical protein HUT16_10270 [Kitasatospora sp. NA04385]|uniref:hypothetical protein n=1 Tax=Kitasatospora sp. NA04385 TaxID=2742135 RepID=UPI0015901557|nr:hypothetical protein [Kitasatospora sp. NA04385]QKW19405.1 hypothetical protein HUT16_10270 [Kitasatospora sp. NA04385]